MIRKQAPREHKRHDKHGSMPLCAFRVLRVCVVFFVLPITPPPIATYAQTLQASIRGQLSTADFWVNPGGLNEGLHIS
jgi:hypothetical protein